MPCPLRPALSPVESTLAPRGRYNLAHGFAMGIKPMTPSPSGAIQPPPQHPTLREGHVHIWQARLDTDATQTNHYQTLAPDEQARATRFIFDKHKRRFSVGRGILRSLLGNYLALPPDQINFNYTKHGKPYLPPVQNPTDLRFNLSHSGELALFAFTIGRDLGIDIEQIRPDRSTRDIAERFFAPREVDALFALPDEQHTDAFFRCWTRKEAYIKAKGAGMAIPLDSFAVSLDPEAPAELLWVKDNPAESARWNLTTLSPDPTFAACVATEGQPEEIQFAKVTHC